jgi:23S rRNA pseudouridine2605 synthase
VREHQGKPKTLDRALSRAGAGSRTEIRQWIAAGRVAVNDQTIQNPDVWITPGDRVTLDGRPLAARQDVYLLLHKPKGYLTTYQDPQGRPTVYDLVKDIGQWIFPAGRLDQDTSGLLILTNDTAFGDYITSPASKVPKTYLAKTSRVLTDAQLECLRRGIELADGPTRPAVVTRLRPALFEITITEGRNRQVRRMIEALDAKVLKLARTRIGKIEIGTLEPGQHRALTPEELAEWGWQSCRPS